LHRKIRDRREDGECSPSPAYKVEAIQDTCESLGLDVEERLNTLLLEQGLDGGREAKVIEVQGIRWLAVRNVQGALLTLCTV
jgi:hypothetical protein